MMSSWDEVEFLSFCYCIEVLISRATCFHVGDVTHVVSALQELRCPDNCGSGVNVGGRSISGHTLRMVIHVSFGMTDFR